MPVKNKRNVRSPNYYSETNHEMYTNQALEEDYGPVSPSALCIPPPTPFRPLSPLSDTEPDSVQETMTYGAPSALPIPLSTSMRDKDEEDAPPNCNNPAAPPQPKPPRVSVETQVQLQDIELLTPSRCGHVRSPVLAR